MSPNTACPAPNRPLRALKIAVIGGSKCHQATSQDAYEVGHLIADAGATLLNGGGSGVMEASAKGASERGGRTIGVLPGTGPADSMPNRYIQTVLYTGMGQARNLILVLSADAVIAIGGEWGTLSEIALAMKHGRPLVLLSSWKVTPPEDLGTDSSETETPQIVDSPAEAVRLALSRAREEPSP